MIRPLAQADYDQWRPLFEAYHTFYHHTATDAEIRTSWERLLSDDPTTHNGLVAEQGGRLLGLTHYLFHRHGWKIEQVCYLQDLYVVPEARGGGIARALIEAVYARADDHGAPSVYWLTQEYNYAARMLYDRVADKTPFIKYQRRP